ncbi:MAG TPA: YMGG-like glycine zipper-containing protein [Gemmatimonadaceae bacterium]|nr:YMGG-like glycine zipper-containing protein [Gemmatimonadaceae bacterium]
MLPVRRSLAVTASLLALAACGRDRGANGGADSTALEADSALARDLAMASESRPATTTFGDTAMHTTSDRVAAAPTPRRTTATNTAPPRPAPARQTPTRPPTRTPSPAPVPQPRTVVSNPAPAPAPAAAPTPAPSGRGFAAGTGFGVATGQKVCTNNLPGDKLVATIDRDVPGRGGAVIPAGSKLVLEVASVDRGDNGSPRITFRVRAVDIAGHSYPATATGDATGPFERTRVASSGSSDAKKVLGGAAAGAILGQILGKNTKGTVIGAAAGAAAGAVVAKRGESYQSCLPSGSPVHLVLQDEVLM